MPLVTYLEQFPMGKLSLVTLHTIPLSLLFFGFLEFFFSHMINNWIQTIHNYFSSSSSSSIRYKSVLSSSFKVKDDENNQESKELIKQSGDNNIDDGSLSREEVEMVMRNLGLFYETKNENVEERFSFNEISDVFEKEEASFEEVKEAFDVFDENKDGYIDALELQKVVRALGLKEEARIENCKRMISVFDQNGDERIDFQEFLKLLT